MAIQVFRLFADWPFCSFCPSDPSFAQWEINFSGLFPLSLLFFFYLDQHQLLCSLSGIFPFGIHWPFLPLGLVLGPLLHTNAWAYLILGFVTMCSQLSLLHQHSMFLFFFSKEPRVYLTFFLGCPKDTSNQEIQNLLIISPPKALCQCWFQPIQPSTSKSRVIFDLLPPLSISMSYFFITPRAIHSTTWMSPQSSFPLMLRPPSLTWITSQASQLALCFSCSSPNSF